MPNLFAMSFEGQIVPTFELRCLSESANLPDGWGLGYYPGGEPSACVLKEPVPTAGKGRTALIQEWDHLEASQFIIHVRRAQWGSVSDANTQPFVRTYGMRDWVFGHAGSLGARLERKADARFEPVGSTDTELVFCELMERIAERGWRSLVDVDLRQLQRWLEEWGELGGMTCVLSDGRDLATYADKREEGGLHVAYVVPPYERFAFGNSDLWVDLTQRDGRSRKGVLVSSEPLQFDGDSAVVQWERMSPGRLVVLRQGTEIARVDPLSNAEQTPLPPARYRAPRPKRMGSKRLKVVHHTSYTYDKAVERSTHLLRLEPRFDQLQRVIDFQLNVTVQGKRRDYEDVFGNRCNRLFVEEPFSKLVVEATSIVDVLDRDPLGYRPLHQRSQIPLVWMPWQQQALQQYLLPPELPETQLHELTDYAMSFVDRNDYDLLDTLLDINRSIFKDYSYVQNSTTIATNAFQVYTSRRGVCQDFANLFICLARLLNIPARYVCGYIYCGPKNPNQLQSEASHAWVQVYLPEVGWKGFDPTNGVLTQTDHIRVAVGRNYLDATPTSGTIYAGGGTETLEVAVSVEALEVEEQF